MVHPDCSKFVCTVNYYDSENAHYVVAPTVTLFRSGSRRCSPPSRG
jgi:hypothetical protein